MKVVAKTVCLYFIFCTYLLPAQKTSLIMPVAQPYSFGDVSPDLKYFTLSSNSFYDWVRYDRWNIKTGTLDTSYFFKSTPDSLKPNGCAAFWGTHQVIFNANDKGRLWLTDSLANKPRSFVPVPANLKSESFSFKCNANKNIVCFYPNRKSGYAQEGYLYSLNDMGHEHFLTPKQDVKGIMNMEISQDGEVVTVTWGGNVYIYFPNELIYNIVSVDSGTVAAKAGLKAGDVVLTKNNQKMTLWAEKAMKIELKVLRGNDTLKIKMDKGSESRFGYFWNPAPNFVINDTSIIGKLEFKSALNKEYYYFSKLNSNFSREGFVPRDIIYSIKTKSIVHEVGYKNPYETATITALHDRIMVGEIVKADTKEKYRLLRYTFQYNDLTKKTWLSEKLDKYSVTQSKNNSDILILNSDKGEWALYSIKQNKIIQKFVTLSLQASDVLCLNPKQTGFCVNNGEDLVNFDMQGKINRETIGRHSYRIEQLQYDSSGKYVLGISSGGMIKWNLKKKSKVFEWDLEDKYGNSSIKANENLSEVYGTYANINSSGLTRLTDKDTFPKLFFAVHLHQQYPPPAIMAFEFDRFDKNRVVIGQSNGMVKSLKKSELSDYRGEDYTEKWSPVLSFHYLDKSHALAACEDGSIEKFENSFEKGVKDTVLHEKMNSLTLLTRNKKNYIFAAGETDITLQKMTYDKLSVEWTLREEYSITDMKVNWDGRFIVANCSDGKIRFLDTEDGKEIIQLYFFKETDDFLITTPDGYFYANREIAQKMKFTSGSTELSNTEGDVRFNRPDIILERLGYANEEFILKLRKFWEKRMRKNGFSTNINQYNAINIKGLEYDQLEAAKTNRIRATLLYDDKDNKAEKLVIYHNGSVISEMVLPKNKKQVELTLEMLDGRNEYAFLIKATDASLSHRYEMAVYNENFEKKDAAQPQFYFIGLGCNNYTDKSYNLNYAEKDISDLSQIFSKLNGANYHELLVTGSALTPDVTNKVREFVATAKPEDVIVLSFSGHGLLDTAMNFYLSSALTNFKSPLNNSIAVGSLENVLNESKCVNRLLLLDACHSGEIDKVEITSVNKVEKSESFVFRGNGSYNTTNAKDENMLMNAFFNDVRTSAGMNMISSSEGAELSLESDQWKNGLFTFALKDALKEKAVDLDENGEITVTELATYLNKRVSTLSNGLQNPGIRYLNPDNNFVIYRIKD